MKKILLLLTFIMLISFSYAQEDVDYYLDDGGYSNRNNAFTIDLSHLFKNTIFVYYEREAKNNLEGLYFGVGLSVRDPLLDYRPKFLTDGFESISESFMNPYDTMIFYPKFRISEFQASMGIISWTGLETDVNWGLKAGTNYRLSLYKHMFHQDVCMFLGVSVKFYNRVALSTQLELGARMFKFPGAKIGEESFVLTNRFTFLLSYRFNFVK